jgi:phosphomannomutase
VSDIDGVRVSTPDGWWLLRASNTQAVLVARCESGTEEGLARLRGMLDAALTETGVREPA